MNYGWEAELKAEESGFSREELRYVPSQSGSPYMEIVMEELNRTKLPYGVVEINPLYRFAREMAEVFDRNLTEYEDTRMVFFDVFMHYISCLDLRQGLSKQEYALRFLLNDLLKGTCGAAAARVVGDFEKGKLRDLLRLILKLYQCGSSVSLFKEAMRRMYPDSLVYASNETARQVLVYVGVKEEERERQRLEFLRDMFLPINYHVFLFWEHHFGIIDVEETMMVDEMVLF